jgi:putative spermidine/putrescine transport system substrate-binding protein
MLATGSSLSLGGPAWAQDKIVRVTHFGGPYQALEDAVGKPFKEAGLGEVEYSASLTPATLGQLQANRSSPPFDVVMLSRPAGVRAGRAGLVGPIDKSKLPNLEQVQQGSLSPENFGIPFILDTVELMYNKTMVETPITSWLDLWRPELKGKIALPSTSVVFAPDFVALIARALGGDEKDPKAIDEAFKKIVELKDSVRTFTTNPEQASALMERGEIAVTPQFGVRVSSVIRNTPDVVRAFPKEGVAARPYDLLIPVGSPRKDVAYAYINFIIGKQAQENLAEVLWATPINSKVELSDEVKDKVVTDFNQLIFWDDTYMASVERDWRTRWERTVQSG